jgi:hypothetical protein
MNWDDLSSPAIDDHAVTEALRQLAGSAVATKVAIEGNLSFEGIVAEVSRMNNLLGLVRSACSVKALTKMQAGG